MLSIMLKMSNYTQGIFKPNNPCKYTGTYPIYYRSGLELNLYRWCDNNDKVLSWQSESVVLPYISPKDGKVHRYFTDGTIELQTPQGVKKYLIEVKPSKQTTPPERSKGKKRSTLLYESVTWAVNNAKWKSAKAWCEKNGYNFVILTEKDLNFKK